MAALSAWPTAVNLYVNERGYSERPERTVDAFPVDHGPPLENRAQAIPSTMISCTILCENAAEYLALETFFSDTLLDGVLHFTRAHPRTGVADQEFKFESFELGRVSAEIHEVDVTLRYFPPVS